MNSIDALKSKYLVAILAVALLSACSWQNTLHQVGMAPDVLRLNASTQLHGAPRFVLPADSALQIVDDHITPAAWLNAASLGVGEVFDSQAASGSTRAYALKVSWPNQQQPEQAGQQTSKTVALLGFTELPKPPPVQPLPIKLLDNRGTAIAHMSLHISPALWGPTWQNPELLQSSFRTLAEALQGG